MLEFPLLEMDTNRSYRSLRDWLKRTRTSQVALAQVVGVSTPHLSNILHGKRRPSLTLALRLQQATGVAVENLVDWRLVSRANTSGEAA